MSPCVVRALEAMVVSAMVEVSSPLKSFLQPMPSIPTHELQLWLMLHRAETFLLYCQVEVNTAAAPVTSASAGPRAAGGATPDRSAAVAAADAAPAPLATNTGAAPACVSALAAPALGGI